MKHAESASARRRKYAQPTTGMKAQDSLVPEMGHLPRQAEARARGCVFRGGAPPTCLPAGGPEGAEPGERIIATARTGRKTVN